MQATVDNPWLADVVRGVAVNAIYEAMKASYKKLNAWFDMNEVPEPEREFPRQGPQNIRNVVEGHAHQFFPRLSPGSAKVVPSHSIDANYPIEYTRFLVGVECIGGRIVYSVDDKLNLDNVVLAQSDTFRRLRRDGWPKT